MNQDNRQTVCTLLAVTAPLAHYAGMGYMAVLLAAGAMLPLTILAGEGLKRISKPEAALELLWLGTVIGVLMPVSGANWPGRKAEMVVPFVILILASLAETEERSTRTSAALFWAVIGPMLLVLGAAAGKIEIKRLSPEQGGWSAGLIAALLYPSLNGANKGTTLRTAVLTGVTSGIIAVLIQGVIGTGNAISPLFEVGRCIGYGGLEIIVSVLLTISWYGFASMGMRAAESFGKTLGITNRQSRFVVLFLAGILILSDKMINNGILIGGCLILWVLVPVLHPKK